MQFNIPAEFKNASGVYIIRNTVNDKVYVGSAVKFWRRFREHRNRFADNTHHSSQMRRFVNKYGVEVLSFELLEVTEIIKETLLGCEQKWIDFYLSYKSENCFNASPTAGSCLGSKQSESAKLSRRGAKRSDEAKRRMSEGRKGIASTFTLEQRERQKTAVSKASKLLAGKPKRPFTAEQRERQVAAVRAARKPMSEEAKQGLSQARKGKARDPEIGKKIAAAHKARIEAGLPLGRPLGTKLTDEQRASMSIARKGVSHWKPESQAKRAATQMARRELTLITT